MTTQINPLPTPPSPADSPADFNTKAFALLGGLPTFVTEANAQAAALDASVAAAGAQAAIATNKAGEALTSANNAAISKTGADSARDAAVIAKNAAEAALDSFDDRYLGQKPADPATDNDGGPLLVGALYFRTTAPTGMKVWTGTTWDDAYANLSSKFDKTGGDVDGNINFTGTARRITGDFSNGTIANRVSFQTSTTNANTVVQALPNGTSQIAQFSAYNQQDPTNSGIAQMLATGSEVSFRAVTAGAGFPASTFLPMTFHTGGSERMRIGVDGTVDITGNLKFPGTARRITGDFSNATIANRLAFQTSAVNGITSVAAIPNGSGTAAQYAVYNSSDVNNATLFDLLVNPAEARIRVLGVGTGPSLPMTFHVGGSERLRIDPTTGNVLATSGALGYGVGAGGTVVQATSKSTAVTLNKPSGKITLNNAELAAGATVAFQFNNSWMSVSDGLVVNCIGGVSSLANYRFSYGVTTTGAALIYVTNETNGSLSEAIALQFQLIKGAAS